MEKIKKRNIRFISLIVSLILMLCVFSGFPNNNVSAAGETSGTCGDNVTWNYNASTYTLTISGTGRMSDYDSSYYDGHYYVTTAPWRGYYNKMKTLVINSGVTSISYEAFTGCPGLTSITIPDSVTSIGSHAFYFCTGLTSIAMPDSVTSIGECAFYGCSRLTSIAMPDSVTSIRYKAFYGTAWDNNQPDGLVYAGKVAYKIKGTCPASVTIKDGTKGIADYAFSGCTGLKSITIPDSVTSIGEDAFYRCTGLTSAFYTGTIEDWNSISIGPDNSQLTNNVIIVEECGSNSYAGVKDNILYIIGTGEMENYKTAASVPWYEYRDEITEIRIESGVTKVGTYAFYCFDNLKTVKSENKDLQLSKYSLNADNKNITAYSTGGGVLQEYCDQNGISFVKPTPDTPSAPVLSAVNGTSITVKEQPGTEYSSDKINWQDSGVFTGLSPVTNYSIYARIKETAEHNASGISVALTVKTTKLNNDNIPPIPTLKSITSSSISVNTETGIEYSINGTSWNTTGTFSGLKSGTEYSIFARYKATATHLASMPSEPLTAKTDKATVSAPAAPDYEAHTENGITLKPNSKYEFSMDGENWQKSNVFTNLSKNTIYRFYQRVAETDTEYASSSSPALITAIPDKPKVINTSIESITVRQIEGFEYCLDDMVWQKSNVFDMLIEDMDYYVYQRIAAIPGEKVYQITSEYTLAFAIEPCVTHTYNGWQNDKNGHWQKCVRCGEITTATAHTFDKWTVTTPPTCTKVGLEKQVCTVCGYEETRNISATGHKLIEKVDNKYLKSAATCTEKAVYYKSCSVCGEKSTETFLSGNALGHKPSTAVRENEIGASCESQGTYDEVVYCSVCKAELSRETKNIPALGHDYKAVITEPTCTEKGYTTHKCTRCDSSYKDTYVEATGHKPGETTIENSVAPTCETAGLYDEVVYCTVCYAELSRDTKTVLALGHDWSEEWSNDGTNHWHKCNRCEKITDNAEHIYGEWIETKPAKVNEKGERKHICEICGYEEYEEFELGYIVGDTNGDEVITDQDAIYLLFSYYFPDKYPVEQPCDFNNDGFVTDQDAIYLLFHYYFPDKYPIE